MTFDVNVYGRSELSSHELVKVVSSIKGLRARCDRISGDVDAVVHYASGAEFTVEGPFQIEPEDIPEGWAEVVGATVLYNVHLSYDVKVADGGFAASVDGGAVGAVLELADRLAERVQGKAIDLQSYEPPEQEVAPARVFAVSERERDASANLFLHMTWFRLRGDAVENRRIAETFLRVARATFPAAVPTRFGTYEPFQGRFPRDSDESFGEMYEKECYLSDLVLLGKAIEGGRIGDWTNDTWSRYQYVSMVFDFGKIARAVDKIEAFFVTFAREAGCFFADAELNDNRYGGTMGAPPNAGGWGGLSRGPQWMTWYMPEYADMVRPYLTEGVTTDFPEGMLHRWTERPATSAELAAAWGRDPWLPVDLLGVIEDGGYGKLKRLEPARVMPESLRPYMPGSPGALRIEAHFAEVRERQRRSEERQARERDENAQRAKKKRGSE